jgi:hypothetical protein
MTSVSYMHKCPPLLIKALFNYIALIRFEGDLKVKSGVREGRRRLTVKDARG